MCNRDEDCAGSTGNSTIGYKFLFCCPERNVNGTIVVGRDITVIDGDKEGFVGCRCTDDPVPTPDPASYVVPLTALYNSSGVCVCVCVCVCVYVCVRAGVRECMRA